MRIRVYNNNRSSHMISKTNGQRIMIYPKSYIDIETDDDREIRYWEKMVDVAPDKYGLTITVSESDSIVSVADGFVSPYTKKMAEQVFNQEQKTDNDPVTDSVQSSVADVETSSSVQENLDPEYTGFYSEEELLAMDKEDLYNLCNNFNIPFRKNASVKTLVSKILEAALKE